MTKKILLFTTLIFAFLTLIINHSNKIQLNELNIRYTTESEYTKLGYEDEDLAVIQTILTEEEAKQIIIKQIPKESLFPYLSFKYFTFNKFEMYEKLRLEKQIPYLETINMINHPHMMSHFYEKTQEAINIDTQLLLVNKNYYLKDDYIPKDLVYPDKLHLLIPQDTTRNMIRKETYDALLNLFEAAKKRGLYLYLSSGYRSFERQDRVYNQYIIEGSDADRYSARAGHSEHQTGLAVDLTAKSVNFLLIEAFSETLEGQFIEKQAYQFGFIIRYPKNKDHLTGYNYEPWHLRYVGKDVAKIIYENNLTFEEYLLKYTEVPINNN